MYEMQFVAVNCSSTAEISAVAFNWRASLGINSLLLLEEVVPNSTYYLLEVYTNTSNYIMILIL